MSFFSKILEKLGLRKDKPEATTTTSPVASPKPAATPSNAKPVTATRPAAPAPTSQTGTRPTSAAAKRDDVAVKQAPAVMPAAPKAISEVDVVKQLEQLAKGTGLNWKVSIVDLLTLLDIDHSREARNELAKELGCPAEFMSDSAKMNTWLHKTVLQKIAENGGNIPQELLD
jgi:uncharacterized protein DUF3597